MESVDRRQRRLLARRRALAATFRKRKRAEADLDLCDRPSPPKVENVSVADGTLLESIGLRRVPMGSALHKYGAQQSPGGTTTQYKAARPTATTMHGPAPPPSRDSCLEHTSEQSDPSNFCPIMYSDTAQQQHAQHAQEAAAPHEASLRQALSHQAEFCRSSPQHTNSYPASLCQVNPDQASLSQANTYQQIPLHSAAADCYPAKHDSFRMISSAVASGGADRLRGPSGSWHQQRCSSQRRKHPCIQREPPPKRLRAVNIAELAAPQPDSLGQPCAAEVSEALERRCLRILKHRVEPPSWPSHWLDAPITPHSLPFQTLAQSTACTAGSAEAACPAGLHCASNNLPASTQRLRDPRLKADAEVLQGAPACFPWGSDPPRQVTHRRPHTPPQTVPQHRQVWPSGHGPPAGLCTMPLTTAPSGASSFGAESGLDDSVAITPDHRQTWDGSHGPLNGFRALCQAHMLDRQQRLLVAARRCNMPTATSPPHSNSRAGVFEPQRHRQNHLLQPSPQCNSKRQLSSQQSSLHYDPAGLVGHHHSPSPCKLNSSTSRFSSPPPAYPSELWHELLPPSSSSSSSSSSAQQQPCHHPQQHFMQCPPSPASSVLLPSSLPHPGLSLAMGGELRSPQLAAHTSFPANRLSRAQQSPVGYPSAPPSAPQSAPPSVPPSAVPACPDAPLHSSSAFQQAVQSASSLFHCQVPHNTPLVSRAPSTPLSWQTNKSFDFPVVHGLTKLGASVWSPDAVVPDNNCTWSPDPGLRVGDPMLMVGDPRLMAGDYGQAGQRGHVGDPIAAELALQELQHSTLEWMASELVQAGSSEAMFCT